MAHVPTHEKARIVEVLCAGLTRMAEGIRERYTNASEEEVRLRLGALRSEPELMKAAFGWDPDVYGR